MFENDSSQYYIKLHQFEGPFDLLLFFIERDELDIYDIPIAKITNDFLDYLKAMDQLNIDLASEFIVMAARLMRIKTQMLLPRRALDEDGQEIDPRKELVQKLIEYKKIKEVVVDLQQLEDQRRKRSEMGSKGHDLLEMSQKVFLESEWESVSVYGLFKAFQNVLQRLEDKSKKTMHRIVDFEFNIQDQKVYINDLLFFRKSLSFEDLFTKIEGRLHAVVTFLALLEMVNNQEIKIVGGQEVNRFWLEKKEPSSEEE